MLYVLNGSSHGKSPKARPLLDWLTAPTETVHRVITDQRLPRHVVRALHYGLTTEWVHLI
ncbi:MAG: hypothetical protein HYV02_03325 [Deltaproteobacteria bacterium]|nr:hypothetical protein [Deltaproteobacteria bacterium]